MKGGEKAMSMFPKGLTDELQLYEDFLENLPDVPSDDDL